MKIAKKNIIYCILLIIFFTSRFWGWNVPWYLPHLSALAGSFYLLTISPSKVVNKSALRIQSILMIAPFLSIIIYTLFLWAIKFDLNIDFSYISSLFTESGYIIIAVCFAILSIRALGYEALDITFWCAVVSYLLGSVFGLFVRCGFSDAIYQIIHLDSSGTTANYIMEVNDITFAFGVYFLYYFLFEDKKGKNHKLKVIISILCVCLGLKRIEIAAILICVLIYFIFEKNALNFKIKSFIVGLCVFVVSYIYIALIHSNTISYLAEKYGIDFSGRLDTYLYMASNYSTFSVGFWGYGYRYIDNLIEYLRSIGVRAGKSLVLSGLHSDTLKLYMELGFIGFTVWMLYQLFYRTNKVRKCLGVRSASVYLLITCYLFILYLTDNVYNYTRTVFVVMLVILLSTCKQTYVTTDCLKTS